MQPMDVMEKSELAYSADWNRNSMANSPSSAVGRMMLSTYDGFGTPGGGYDTEDAMSVLSDYPPTLPPLPPLPSKFHTQTPFSPVGSPDSPKLTSAPKASVPSLPPVGQPTLRQIALMKEQPDYRSPTYSVYAMYNNNSPKPV